MNQSILRKPTSCILTPSPITYKRMFDSYIPWTLVLSWFLYRYNRAAHSQSSSPVGCSCSTSRLWQSSCQCLTFFAFFCVYTALDGPWLIIISPTIGVFSHVQFITVIIDMTVSAPASLTLNWVRVESFHLRYWVTCSVGVRTDPYVTYCYWINPSSLVWRVDVSRFYVC